MRRCSYLYLIPLIALTSTVIAGGKHQLNARTPEATPAVSARVPIAITTVFGPNAGQFDARVKFYARGPRYTVFATDRGVTLVFAATPVKRLALELDFVGGSVDRHVEGALPDAAHISYFGGADPAAWRSNLPTHRELRYADVWPGIEASVAIQADRLKYQFLVNPGAKPDSIRLRYNGAKRLALGSTGDLHIETDDGTLVDAAPSAFQSIDGRQVPVSSRFVLGTGGEYRISVGDYDETRPLVIDPAIQYASYLGSAGVDEGRGIAVDASGNAYVTGFTWWIDFPTTNGAYQTGLGGGDTNNPKRDAFVAKINASGTALIYATYLGGTDHDEGNAIAVDSGGNAYITGQTRSADFPTTAGAFQRTGALSAFVTKLNSTGSALVYSTYYGASLAAVSGDGIAVDTNGRAYVVGSVSGADRANLPITPTGFQQAYAGRFRDGFLMRLAADGANLEYATFIGGSDYDSAHGVAVQGTDAFVAGSTLSADFPTTPWNAFDAVGRSAIFESANAGATWTDSAAGLRVATIQALAVDPTNPDVVYAGSKGQGIYKRTGTSSGWTSAGSGVPAGVDVRTIVVHPLVSEVVYAATTDGIYKSMNGGGNWSRVGLAGYRVSDISINRAGTAIFAAAGALWKSTDSGASWSVTRDQVTNAVTTDPANADVVFAGGYYPPYLVRSRDGGNTWTAATSAGLGPIHRVRIDRGTSAIYAAAGHFGLFRSTDGGASFTKLSGAFIPVDDVGLDSSTIPTTIYGVPLVSDVGTGFLLKSTDGGSTVTPVAVASSATRLRSAVVTGPSNILVGVTRLDEAFVIRVNTASAGAGSLVYSTYLSGAGEDAAKGIAVDGSGRAYVAGWTSSGDFPTTSSPESRTPDNRNAFVASLSATGSTVSYSNVLGGSVRTDARSIGVDSSGIAYVAGLWGAASYVAKMSGDGTTFTPLLFPERNEAMGANGVAVGADGSAYVVGSTTSTDFPTTLGSVQPTYGSGASDAFVAKVSFDTNGGGGVPAEIVIYANDVPASALHGSWGFASDSSAAGGTKLITPDRGVSNTTAALAAPTDYIDISFEAAADTPYRLWLRMRALDNSKYNDSVWVQFSDATANGAGIYGINSTSALLVNLATDATAESLFGWGWQNGAYWISQPTTMRFAASGTHTMRIQVREDGVQLDQIVLSPVKFLNAPPGRVTNDSTIVQKPMPASPGNIVIYASDIAPTSRHGSWATASDPTAAAGVKLMTPDNGGSNLNNPLASPTDYADVMFNADAGTAYTIWMRLRATADSKWNDAVWVQFSDARANGAPAYPLNTTSGLLVNLATDSTASSLNGWGWQNTAYWLSQPTRVTFATSGSHTMRIQVREDGVQFDQIVLSPNDYSTAPPGPVGGDHTIVAK
jgi:hypothetical protein